MARELCLHVGLWSYQDNLGIQFAGGGNRTGDDGFRSVVATHGVYGDFHRMFSAPLKAEELES